MGYFTHLHLSVQKWNKRYNTHATVQVDNTGYTVSVEMNTVDAYLWMFTWNREYPHLTKYTTLADRPI